MHNHERKADDQVDTKQTRVRRLSSEQGNLKDIKLQVYCSPLLFAAAYHHYPELLCAGMAVM